MQKLTPLAALLSVLWCLSPSAVAEPAATRAVTPGADLTGDTVRRGWHFYRDPAKDKPTELVDEKPLPLPVKPEPAPEQPTVVIGRPAPVDDKEKCKARDTWRAACGFVDPGADFEFQAKQRDILLQQMSLRPEDPAAVEAAQYYMKWVVGKASQAANMWYFNMVQNPDLDPTVKNPVSEIGISLASKITQATQYEYFNLMREEGGKLFLFSRDDCQFCHDQAPYARRVARSMGLQLINIPLDGKCLPGFVDDDCGDNIAPEQTAVLQVKIVPTLFLYVPANTWIRLGSGIVTDTTVLANAVNFFSAYRAAMIQGLDNGSGSRPSVSFNPDINTRPTGTVAENGAQSTHTPDRTRLLNLMGYGAQP